ncbi:MAG: hypothetical protein JW755_05760 [Candidatus Aminicenantes bacterium]|nr:hypothetical protein [Candidatus Aminicenantes bacterium]
MNDLKIGDKIIYPNQGLGIIEDIQRENYFGENYYVFHVRLINNNTLVLVPVSCTEEIGIRKPIPEKNINRLFEFIGNSEVDIDTNWKGRYKEYQTLMRNGTILEIATVLKSLYYLNLTKPLSYREKKMLEKAMELVVQEVSEVASLPTSQIEEKLLSILSLSFKDLIPRIESR